MTSQGGESIVGDIPRRVHAKQELWNINEQDKPVVLQSADRASVCSHAAPDFFCLALSGFITPMNIPLPASFILQPLGALIFIRQTKLILLRRKNKVRQASSIIDCAEHLILILLRKDSNSIHIHDELLPDCRSAASLLTSNRNNCSWTYPWRCHAIYR